MWVLKEKTMSGSLRTPKSMQETPFKPTAAPPLTPTETAAAVDALYTAQKMDGETAMAFRKLERRLVDPPLDSQQYALFTFVPAPDAKPDKDNVYGMIKLRGNFRTLDEADERAEFLIRESDSMHSILTGYVGAPMPLLSTSTEKDIHRNYGAALKEVKLSDKTKEAVSSSVVAKRQDEKVAMKEMQQREQELKDDVAKQPEDRDSIEKYIETRVKRSQLIVTLEDGKKRLREIASLIRRAQETLDTMDAEFPEFSGQYTQMYNKARDMAGVPDDDNSYIKYLDANVDLNTLLGFLEE